MIKSIKLGTLSDKNEHKSTKLVERENFPIIEC